MAFLQVKNNLGDLNNICEAQKTLGLMSMAYQCKNNVDIRDGKIAVSNLRINDTGVDSNYVLVAKNSNGDVMWKRQALQEWMQSSPSDILLSSFSNDQNYIKETEINITISNYIDEFRDTIINNNLVIDSITISNIKVNNSIEFIPENLDLIEKPCVLTNNGFGSNVQLTFIDQSFSNDNSNTVCSSRAISNLYDIVKDVQASLPTNVGSTYMISTNNLNEVGFNPDIAVENLGLKESFITNALTLSNVYFNTPDVIPEINYNRKYYLYRHQDTLSYKEIINVTTYDSDVNASIVNPASSKSVYDLYTDMNNAVNDRLITSNVLSEFFEPLEDGTVNPQIDLFKERLQAVGIQQVAFTSNWYHLGNAPRKLSAFSNTDFNDDTLFIYGKCNLSDLWNPTQAMINLGVSRVGQTGNFADLLLPTVISNIITADDVLGAIPGIPFLVKTEFLSELSNNSAYARSNLGIDDMATFNQYNVEILNGNISACNVVINSNLRYLHSNTSIAYAGMNGNNTFLKCFTSDGLAKWDALPIAETTLSTQGIVYLTNDLTNSSSNVAITAYALSNVFYNNDRITDLVPLATSSGFGIVKSTTEFKSPELSDNVVVNSIGISNMYYELNSNIDEVKEIVNTGTTNLIYSRLEDVTVSNYNGNNLLQIADVNSGNDRKKEISLNFPNTNNEYLAADGTFKVVQPTTLHNPQSGLTFSNNIQFWGHTDILEFDDTLNRVNFKNTIYTPSNGIGIDLLTRKISNTGIVTADPLYFNTTSKIIGNEITLKGGLIGNIGQNNISGTINNTYLKYSETSPGVGIYNFESLDLNDFTSTSRGFVPTPTSINQVLTETGWISYDTFHNDIPLFTSNTNGLVRKYQEGGQKADKFLNAEGAWIDKVDIMDLTGAVTSLNINSVNNNVLTVSSSTNDVEIGFHNANNNQVITKNTDNEYVWRNPFELIRDDFTFPDGTNHANMYLNGVGNFIVPPGAMNFAVNMNYNENNNILTITQNLTESLPTETTYSNTINLNFINKYNDIIYQNGDNYLRISPGSSSDQTDQTFNNINDVIGSSSESNRIFTISATKKYIDQYVDYFRSTHVSGIDFKDDLKLITPFGVSNYVNDNYLKVTEIINDLDYEISDVNGSTVTDVLSLGTLSNLLFNVVIQNTYISFHDNKVLSSEALSNYVEANYINENEKFNYNDTFETNHYKIVRASNVLKILEDNRFIKTDTNFEDDRSFVTPFALSNYTNINYIKLNEKTNHLDNVNSHKDEVIIGGTLSNYVNEQVTFSYDKSFTGTNFNKIVRASNVLKILEDNRYDKDKNINFLDDDRFTTPFAVSNYVNANYIKSAEKTTMSIGTLTNINNFDPNDIFSIGATSNLLFNEVIKNSDTTFANNQVFSSETMSNYISTNYINVNEKTAQTENPETYKNKVIIGGTLSNYVNHIFYDNIQLSIFNPYSIGDFEDENYKFPTANTVKNYVNYVINDSPSIQTKIDNSLSVKTYSYNSSTDNIVTDDKYITPYAVSNYVNTNYLKISNRQNLTPGQNTLDSMSTFNKDDIFSIGALSNLLFRDVIQDSYHGNFDTNKVLSSVTMSNYVANNYLENTKLLTQVDSYENGFYYGGYDDIYIPTTATTSNIANVIIDDRSSTATTLEHLTSSHDVNKLINELNLWNIVLEYEKHNRCTIDENVVAGNYTGNNTNFMTDYDPNSSYNCNIIPTVDLVKDLIDAKIRNVTKNTPDHDAEGKYKWTDRSSLSNDTFLPTIGLMKDTIDGMLAQGITLNMVDLVVDYFTVNQQLTFYPNDANRTNIEYGKQFMTIDSDGHAIFRPIETISGLNTEVTEDDEYSMVTGTYTKTFGNNQFVCGEYNSSNNIYKQIELDYPSVSTSISGHDNEVNFVVGTGTENNNNDRKNGFEVHNTGEVYVRSNLILGDWWRLSFDDDTLTIEKREGSTYVQKHIFK
jgi:hypothetical protein